MTSPTQTSLRKRKSCLLNFLLGSPKCKSCASEGLGWGSLGGQRAARKEEGRFRPIAHEVSCRPRTPCVPHLSPTTTSSGFSIGSSSLCSLTDPSIRCEGTPCPRRPQCTRLCFLFFCRVLAVCLSVSVSAWLFCISPISLAGPEFPACVPRTRTPVLNSWSPWQKRAGPSSSVWHEGTVSVSLTLLQSAPHLTTVAGWTYQDLG